MERKIATRRQFLKRAGAISATVPAGYSIAAGVEQKSTSNNNALKSKKKFSLTRNFDSDILELARILKEISEVEHSLMLQYLYAGFSVKPEYSSIVGSGAPDSTSLIGVAVQEMQHLGSVNRLLVELGVAPNLGTQDFPFEYEIYPFSMTLEPLSLASAARYAYCESPPIQYAANSSRSGEDQIYQGIVDRELGKNLKINRVGSVYEVVIDMFADATSESQVAIDRDYWIEELRRIMEEGEHDHYRFFRSLVTGSNPAFKDNPQVWASPQKAAYPAYAAAVNPTAYLGHPNTIQDQETRTLAWLGNLYYWSTLILLDLYYREQDNEIRDIALLSMMGPLKIIGQTLAQNGSGLPFDKLSLGTSPCCSRQNNLDFCVRLLREAATVSRSLGHALPTNYPEGIENVIQKQLEHKISSLRVKTPGNDANTLIAVTV